jgi:ribosome maturation factor RimP
VGSPPTFFIAITFLSAVNDELEGVVTTELAALGYELVEFRRRGSKSRPVLDLRVERADGARIGVDDCARVSRAVEARLEATRLVGERYVLEVSSPGIERPLRQARDWQRAVGQPAVVTAQPLPGGKAEVTVVALEGEPGAEVAVVRDAKGVEHRLALADVTQARLAFHWNTSKE